MKVLNVNGWLGRLNSPLSRLISKEGPEIACIQEAFAPGTKSLFNFSDQYQYIDELIAVGQFRHLFFSPSWGFEMGGEVIQVGNIILSKFPLLNKGSFNAYGEYTIKNSDDDQRTNIRVLQTCQVKLPKKHQLSLANYQGYLPAADPIGDEITVSTIKKTSQKLKLLSWPLIFCADLNISKSSPAFDPISELGLRNLIDENNVKSTLSQAHRASAADRDSVACDFIFVSNDIEVKSFSVSEELVSDHKALILEFDL